MVIYMDTEAQKSPYIEWVWKVIVVLFVALHRMSVHVDPQEPSCTYILFSYM